MKLKRLIAIAVVLTTLLSCSCIAGSTVYAADTDETLYHFDGRLVQGAAAANFAYAEVDIAYSVYGTTAGKISEYRTNGKKPASANRMMSIWEAGKLEDVTNKTARFTFHAAGVLSGGSIYTRKDALDDYYYEVTYPSFGTQSTSKEVNVSDNVLSVSFDFCIPASEIAIDRKLLGSQIKNSSSARLEVSYDYDDNGKGTVIFSDAGDLDNSYVDYDFSWVNPVEISADVWYKIDLRYTLDDNGVLVVGAYLDGTQFAYFTGNEASGDTIEHSQLWLGNYSAGTIIHSSPLSTAYFDDILVKLLADKENMAPSADKPTGEDPEVPAVSDEVVYDAPVFDGNKVTVTANIKGYNGVTGNAVKVIALFNASGRVSKLVSTPFDFPAVSTEPRQVTVELEDKGVATATKVKVFFFNSLTSPTPLLPSFSGTIN